ncbi:MAG: alpha/beta fold hydrolase [Thermomicrobiales bacterium]
MPIATVGDLDIAYDIDGPETAPAVLMINGLGADHGGWFQQVPAISRDFRTITFDNRDVGLTGPGRNPRRYGIPQFARDAAGLLDHLGIERAHIVGASMGGAIAQEFALTFPARTASVSIVCSWAKTDPWLAELFGDWERIFAAQGQRAFARTSWLWVFTHRFYNTPGNLDLLLDGLDAAPRPQTAEEFIRQSQAAISHDALARLGEIACPAHIIAGADDLLTPLRFSEEIAAAMPDARFTVMPNVGHGMFWETVDAFNDHIISFLNSAS